MKCAELTSVQLFCLLGSCDRGRPGQPSAEPAGSGRVEGVHVEKKIKGLEKRKKVSDAYFLYNSTLLRYFGGVYSLRRISQNMPIFWGVYIEWVWPGLCCAVLLHH